MKIALGEKETIRREYEEKFIPMAVLAERYKVTRHGIYKILRNMGVDTTKKGGVDVVCTWCNEYFKKPRYQVRVNNHCFCSQKCYYDYVNRNGKYSNTDNEARMGQRRARRIISRYYSFSPGQVVHHEDKNTLNNTLQNLRVFANQADHIRYHRGFGIEPVWSGLDVIKSRKGS